MTAQSLPVPRLLRLTDGRVLAWYEFGDPDGPPCVYMPGTPESGLAGACYATAAASAGIRWISVDRPGYGISDPHPGRSLLDIADDVRELLDHLQLEHAAIVGESGGGPHALAAAHAIHERVPLLVLLAAMGPGEEPWVRRGMRPTNQVLFWMSRIAPRSLVVPMRLMKLATALTARFPSFGARLGDGLPEPDRRAMSEPDYHLRHLAGPDAFRQGARWPAQELALFARPWSFALADVTTPVHMWHGHLDVNVPISVARSMSRVLPNVTTHFANDSAHAVGFERRAEIMAVIRSTLQAAARGEAAV